MSSLPSNPSEAFKRLNPEFYETRSAASRAQLEPAVRHESMATEKREAINPGRIQIRIVSYRRRLLDPDNLCPKYFIDCLRYSNLITDDREQDIELQTRQVKVKAKSDERTEIELITPTT